MKQLKWLLPVLFSTAFLVACKKDKVACPTEPTPTKWEQIAGDYKVYDTLGVYLYDMSLVHTYKASFVNDYDSIRFENFDGDFTFTDIQFSPSNYPMHVSIGSQDTLYDSQSKRWKVSGGLYSNYNNWENDTIKLRFQKTNINYYLLDLVPFYSCDCIQIAVKQP